MKSTADRPVFWSTVGAVSIRTKVMGIAAVCILIAAAALLWHHYDSMSTALRDQLQQRGVSIANSIAAQSRDLILTDNQFPLYALAKDSLGADRDLAYVLIFDHERNILIHTFNQGMPLELLGKNQIQAEEPFRVQALKTEEGIIYDIAVPILGGQAGIVRLGMSEGSIRAEINKNILKDMIWVGIVLVVGLYIAYGMAAFLTRPISRLAEAARAVGTRDFKWETPAWARDEIGSLGATFNEVSEELRHKEEMREQLLGKVITAQEDERKRVARELHDEVGQALTMIMMDLAQTRDMLPDDATEARKRVSRSRSLAEQTLTDLRKLIYELRPEVLDHLGLVAALRSYAKNRLQTENIEVQLHFLNIRDRLSPEVETTLFRIIQEAITNIIRHSRTTMVDITIEVEGSTASATIKDNGIGFDVETTLTDIKSFGLRGIRERATAVGGELKIESEVGHGTCLKVSIPLNGRVYNI